MADYILGSGDLYILVADAVPEDATLEVEANKIGHISGGATLTYSNDTYEVVDDYNLILGRHITKENVTFKSGVLTWDLSVLGKLLSTGTFTAGSEGTPDKLTIGGKSGAAMKNIVVRFVHENAAGKKLKVTIVGNNDAGLELAFAKDKETIVDAEIKAISQSTGILVEITMEK